MALTRAYPDWPLQKGHKRLRQIDAKTLSLLSPLLRGFNPLVDLVKSRGNQPETFARLVSQHGRPSGNATTTSPPLDKWENAYNPALRRDARCNVPYTNGRSSVYHPALIADARKVGSTPLPNTR